MGEFEQLLGLFVAAVILAGIARRVGAPYPVFLALGAVLLIQGFYAGNGIKLEPLQIALWALPTAIAAFVIHSVRIVLFQRRMARNAATGASDAAD